MSDEQAETLGDDPRDVRLGRILDDYLSRRSRGETVTEAELVSQHPELADDLREMLVMVRDLRPPGERIDALIEQAILKRSADPRYLATLGAYRITGYVGHGGMGVVLEAYEESLNRTVALKILRPELADDQAILARFEREAQAAAGLRHPNIVTVHAVGREGRVFFIAMEYVEGTSLADLIRARGPLPTRAARRILRELLLGLEAAHKCGLIHRDIKSSNVLLDGWPNEAIGVPSPPPAVTLVDADDGPYAADLPSAAFVKIVDFGLARARTGQATLTLAGSVFGTPEYMSPEQARGDENIDHRTDLYSAGVVLYEMLTGRVPFKADSATAVIHQILNTDPPDPRALNPSVDSNLSSLALRLMAKSPEDRFGSASDVIKTLDEGERVRSPAGRRRARRHLATALAGLVLVTGAVWLLSRLASRPGSETPAVDATPAITEVWVQRREGQPATTILATYGDEPTPKVFHGFPAEVGEVKAATLVDRDGQGEKAVVAGLRMPLDGCNVFAFDARGDELWRLDVGNVPPDRRWPDCGPPAYWPCRLLAGGSLDGEDGYEVVVVASDSFNYPTRVSVVDPRTRNIRSTFWHMGHLLDVQIAPGFLDHGRPAIIARAINNKLDGFGLPYPPRPYQRPADEDPPRTRYDQVTVAMVLDPADMDGLGPPRTPRKEVQDIGVARPFAYALLDRPILAGSGSYVPEGATERRFPKPHEWGSIASIQVLPRAGSGDDAPRMNVFVGGPAAEVGGAVLEWRSRWQSPMSDIRTGRASIPRATQRYWSFGRLHA